MLNSNGQPMHLGHCDKSVYSVFQNKIPDDGGDYYLYQKPKDMHAPAAENSWGSFVQA